MTSKEEQNEIKILKEEEIKETQFWSGYSNKLKEQIKSENIFEEVEIFKTLKNKEKNNFFKKILKTLGF
jgi:RNA polymerase-interacting CarD/CdnL/TRCF family regulator